MNKFPGLVANIGLLRRIGYKKIKSLLYNEKIHNI